MNKKTELPPDNISRTIVQKIGFFFRQLLYRFTIPTLLFIFVLGMGGIFLYIQNQQNVLINKFQREEVSLYQTLQKSGVVDQHPIVLTHNTFMDMENNLEDTFIILTASLALYFIVFIFIIRKFKSNSEKLESFVGQLREMNTELHNEISARDQMSVKLKSLNNELKYQSLHDSLTDLPNRRLFEDRLNLNISASARNKLIFAVMIMDLDGFKLINDTLGHDVGDELLKEVSKRMENTIRGMDTVARLGGDEFAFILTSLDAPESAAIVSDRLLQALRNTIHVKNEELHISASVGIAIYPQDGNDSQILLKNADIAMYQAKNMGRGNFQFYRESMNAAGSRELKLRSKFHEALENDALEMHYQPIIDVQAHQVIGFEALLRWHDLELGAVSPLEMLKVANHLGLQLQLSEWITEAICKQINAWKEQAFDVPKISMNVTSFDLDSNAFVDNFESCLKKYEITGEKIILEVTESSLVSNTPEILAALNRLKDLHIKIAIDDFGTGYSSLSYLQKLPIQILKIDKSFVQALEHDGESTAIVEAIISIGKALKMDFVAEGVETKSQRDVLLKLGCTKMQGFLYSKALASSDCVSKIISAE